MERESTFESFQLSDFRGLFSNRQSLRQHPREARLDDFLLRGLEIVFHAPLFHHPALHVVNAVSGPPFAVSRLTDQSKVLAQYHALLEERVRALEEQGAAAPAAEEQSESDYAPTARA